MMTMGRQKTGVPFDVTINPRLQEAIDAMPGDKNLTFLVTHRGRPFTAAGFGNWVRKACRESGASATLHRIWRHRSSAPAVGWLDVDLPTAGLHGDCAPQ